LFKRAFDPKHDWPGQQFSVPLLLTEIGVTRESNDAAGQGREGLCRKYGVLLPQRPMHGHRPIVRASLLTWRRYLIPII
jgi:hypothetical protein